MDSTARFKKIRKLALIWIGMEWSKKPIIIGGEYIEDLDEWILVRMQALSKYKQLSSDIEPIIDELDKMFNDIKMTLLS